MEIRKFLQNRYNALMTKTSRQIRMQFRNPLSIPVIIINYNQLYYLRQMVDFLFSRDFKNIIIIDNKSDYQPLLDYYREIEGKITIERMSENYGHMVFFENEDLQRKYGQGFYFLTDADIVPNENLPKDFARQMLRILMKYYTKITKVGFALDLKSIPDYFPLKNKVLLWEMPFWQEEVEPDIYKANLDTTFALYKPRYPKNSHGLKFLQAVRMGGNFTAKHGGWYINPQNYTDEQLHYIKTVDKSGSWKLNEEGRHDNKGNALYNWEV